MADMRAVVCHTRRITKHQPANHNICQTILNDGEMTDVTQTNSSKDSTFNNYHSTTHIHHPLNIRNIHDTLKLYCLLCFADCIILTIVSKANILYIYCKYNH